MKVIDTSETLEPDSPSSSRLRRVVTSATLWLALICAGQIALAVRPGLISTPFEDEALYVYMGHRMIQYINHGSFLHEYPGAYFSGAPGLYPVLAAMGDFLGGLQGARTVSLCFAILATIGVYGLGSQLFGKLAGLIGALTFTLCGSVIYQSYFATFDSTTLALISIAAWLIVYSTRNDGLLWAPIVSALLALAFLVKYAGAAYAPIVIALAVAVGWRQSRWTIVRRAAYVFLGAVVMVYFVIELWGQSLVPGIQTTTTSRTILNPATKAHLIGQILNWVGPWLILASLGGLLRLRRNFMVVTTLIVGALIGPVQHVRIEESTSLAKHVAFGIVFAAPLIGDLLGRMVRRAPVLAAPLVASVVVALCLSGLHYSSVFRSGWVPNDNIVQTLAVAVSSNPNKEILGEQPAPERYALRKVVDSTYWNDTYSFSYAGLTGKRAYRKAIDQSHFGVIYLTMKTTNGKYVNWYLSTHKTPYQLSAKVPRYMRRSYVGDWLIYTPRRWCLWRSKGKCGPPVTGLPLRLKVAESDPEGAD